MSDLIKQLRKSRESKTTVGKFSFTILRPTHLQMVTVFNDGLTMPDVVREYVVGWDNVTEVDILEGATTDPVPFDKLVWAEWLSDRPDFWSPLHDAILKAYRDFAAKTEQDAKN